MPTIISTFIIVYFNAVEAVSLLLLFMASVALHLYRQLQAGENIRKSGVLLHDRIPLGGNFPAGALDRAELLAELSQFRSEFGNGSCVGVLGESQLRETDCPKRSCADKGQDFHEMSEFTLAKDPFPAMTSEF